MKHFRHTTSAYYFEQDNLYLCLKVLPRATKSQWLGIEGEYIRVRISAPPVEGKANQYLIKFMAELFDVPPTSIVQLSGQTTRIKRFKIPKPKRLPKDIIG